MKVWNRKPFFVISTNSKFCLSFLFVCPKFSGLIWSAGIPGTNWKAVSAVFQLYHNLIFSTKEGGCMYTQIILCQFLIGYSIDSTPLQNYLRFLPRKDSKIQIEFPPFYRLKSVSKLLTVAIRRCHLEPVPPLPIWISRYFPEKAQSSGRKPPPWLILRNSISTPTPPPCARASMCRGGIKYKGGS